MSCEAAQMVEDFIVTSNNGKNSFDPESAIRYKWENKEKLRLLICFLQSSKPKDRIFQKSLEIVSRQISVTYQTLKINNEN